MGDCGSVLADGIGHVIGADDIGDIGLREFVVDVLQLEHLVIRHVGFGEQHVHVARHAARDRVDGVFHLDAFLLQHVGHFAHACWACATAMP